MGRGETSYDSVSTGSPPQEFFPIPKNPKGRQILSNFKAGLPPVFQAKRSRGISTRISAPCKVNQIKSLTRKPARSLPSNALTTWKDLPTDVKLPDIRRKSLGDIYYTRGRLCKTLNRTKPEFDLGDPYNQRKVIDLKEYSALHDPHCKTYFKRPSVLKHLKKQKLINNRNEVLCNAVEFNHYRAYLGSLFSDQVRRRINDSEAMKEMERGVSIAICKKQKRKENFRHKQYQEKHRLLHQQHVDAIKQEGIKKIENWKRKLREIEQQKAKFGMAQSARYTFKHWSAFKTRQKADMVNEQQKKKTLVRIAYSETKNDYTSKYDKFVKLALFERFKADQAAALIARDDQIDDMEQLVEESLKKSRTSWVKNYETVIERCRRDPLSKYKMQKKAQARERYLMRKYFDLWVDYIIENRQLKSKDLHHSTFMVDKKLKPFVNKMKTLSSSDLESGDELSCGDNACRIKKRKAEAKLNHLVRMFPSPINIDKPSVQTVVGRSFEAVPSNSAPKKGYQDAAKIVHHHHHDEGNDADLDEADTFIDNMVARYKAKHDQLNEKLRTKATPTKHDALNSVPLELQSVQTFDKLQTEQKETIRLLYDVNDVMKTEDKDMQRIGWKAMK